MMLFPPFHLIQAQFGFGLCLFHRICQLIDAESLEAKLPKSIFAEINLMG